MKNHFYISYFGNKRNEVIDIVKCIPKLETYEKIIEPFCGSCAISY
jgi:site-specific DNA-adenine methylase